MPALFFIYSRLSYLLHLFRFSYFILAVPMRECLGEDLYRSPSFPIAILNGTCSFPSLVQEEINMPSDTIIGFIPEVAIKTN